MSVYFLVIISTRGDKAYKNVEIWFEDIIDKTASLNLFQFYL